MNNYNNPINAVFIGDSITKAWADSSPTFFKQISSIVRGVNGETTVEILNRFKVDVIKTNPKIVVILAGINDIAGNSGFTTNPMIQGNISKMAEMASQHNIKVLLCSILPANNIPWRINIDPSSRIQELNNWLKSYCEQNHFTYVDFYSSLVDGKNGLDSCYTKDGVHTNKKGYKVMSGIIEPIIHELLSKIL